VSLLSKLLKADKKRRIFVRVRCPAAAGLCDARMGIGVGTLTLGNTSFLLRGGKSATLVIRSSAKGLKAARRKKKVTVIVLSRDNAGTAAIVTKSVKFK
jgi:hypothetical protein